MQLPNPGFTSLALNRLFFVSCTRLFLPYRKPPFPFLGPTSIFLFGNAQFPYHFSNRDSPHVNLFPLEPWSNFPFTFRSPPPFYQDVWGWDRYQGKNPPPALFLVCRLKGSGPPPAFGFFFPIFWGYPRTRPCTACFPSTNVLDSCFDQPAGFLCPFSPPFW